LSFFADSAVFCCFLPVFLPICRFFAVLPVFLPLCGFALLGVAVMLVLWV